MRFLLIDIGAGTMDVLYWDSRSDHHYKAVVKSPVRALVEKADHTKGDLLVTGCEMGGGQLSGVLYKRAGEAEVVMTGSAATTLHHDLEKVRAEGIRIVDERTAHRLAAEERFSRLVLGDFQIERIEKIIDGFGVPFCFDIIAVCAQDHGVPPRGVSHLDYRHNLFKEKLDEDPFPQTLLYRDHECPETFSRLTAIAKTAAGLPAGEIYVMDSGMAAILGASLDSRVQCTKPTLVLDVATSHTVGAALYNNEIAGFFEYHTHDITARRLDRLLVELADGELVHKKLLDEGGHGAYIRKAVGFNSIASIIATGPRRGIIADSKLTILPGAPMGDNMMTGTAGLLEAVRYRKKLKPFSFASSSR